MSSFFRFRKTEPEVTAPSVEVTKHDEHVKGITTATIAPAAAATTTTGVSSSGVGDHTTPPSQHESTRPPPPPQPVQPPPLPPSATGDHDDIKVTVEDEPEEDPVRAELEHEVRQRDASISALEKARQEKLQQLAELEQELEKERLQQMKEALMHKIESERIKRQTMHAEDRLRALEQDMQDKAAIHEYANLIKGVAPKSGVDSQYVLKLQTQLQKAVKKMETTTQEMKSLEKESQQVADALSTEIAQLVEDRCKTELELRKQMEVLEEQKRDLHLSYEDRIRENLKMLQALRAKAVNQTTIEELEEELEEAEIKLEELNRIQEKQAKTIEALNKSLGETAM